jgi:NAD(P)-dependent dehydrogenase (short-subunit alcohol dehydrogenase family)
MDFAGKTAVVLGASASGGIGWATAEAFAARGAKVLVAARRHEPLEQLAQKIGGTAMVADGTREADIRALARRAAETYGQIDFAVNCVGLPTNGAISEATAESLQPALDANYVGAVLFTRHMAEAMRDGGAITLISSTAVDRIMPPNFSYACAKAATECLARYAALEYGPRGIRVNAVIPGLIVTDLTAPMMDVPGAVEAFTREIPLGRCGYPRDIAETIMWLSAPGGYITGVALPVSGGNQLTRLPRMDELPVVSPV